MGLGLLRKFGWLPACVRKALASTTRTVNATSHSCSSWMPSILQKQRAGLYLGLQVFISTQGSNSFAAVQLLTCSRVDLLSDHSPALYLAKDIDTSLSEVTRGINRSFLRLSIFVGGN